MFTIITIVITLLLFIIIINCIVEFSFADKLFFLHLVKSNIFRFQF